MISIIMPVHNAENYIAEAIKSVIKQTYKIWELIIIDDKSEDNSLQIVCNFQKIDKRIKIIRLSNNQGASAARNEGIKYSVGDYLAFLDADDIWIPEKLNLQLDFMKKNNILFSFTNYSIVKSKIKICCPKKISYNLMLISCFIGCSTVMINQKFIGKTFFENFKIRNDYVYWLKILKKVENGFGIPIITTKIRRNRGSLSSNYFKNFLYYIKVMMHERQNLIKIIFFLLPIYILIQVFKKYINLVYNYFINLTYARNF